MKFPLLNIDGTKASSIEVSDKLVKLKVNYKLIKFVIDWQLNHLKPRTAKTKQRNEVKGSTKKIVAQKGSGGARHASKKAPLFVGGGVAHGPKGAVYKVKKINKKVRKLALAQTFSKKNLDKNLQTNINFTALVKSYRLKKYVHTYQDHYANKHSVLHVPKQVYILDLSLIEGLCYGV